MTGKRIRRHGRYYTFGIVLILAACAREPGASDTAAVVVAVPVNPIAGLVDALAPEGLLEVVVLVPPGANPATYDPSISALRRMAFARLYLEVAHPNFIFESLWLDGALEGSGAVRIPLFRDCPVLDGDSHVWMSTRCLAGAASATAEALAQVLPERSEEIAANLEEFRRRLERMAKITDQRLAPHRGRMFFVLHPAWGYLASDNDLQQIEILSHGTGDPGASRIAELIRLGRAQGVRTIFAQPQFNRAPADLVAEELGANVLILDPLVRDPLLAIEQATSALVAEFENRSPN